MMPDRVWGVPDHWRGKCVRGDRVERYPAELEPEHGRGGQSAGERYDHRLSDPSRHGITREQATDYLASTTGYARARSQREVERYCTLMGQACSYKVGHRAWVDARDEAKRTLGPKFDIKQFHEVLREGAMPLSILQRRIRERTAMLAGGAKVPERG